MVSVFKNIKRPVLYDYYSVDYVLDKIQRAKPKNRDKVLKYRETGDKRYKTSLPVVTWNGEFVKRNNNSFLKSSGFMYVDIDEPVSKGRVFKIPFIKSVWQSVSGKGVGCLVRVNGLNPSTMRGTFEHVRDIFKENNIVIDNLSDISRGNFISYDENLLVRDAPEIIEAVKKASIKNEALKKHKFELSGDEDYDACSISLCYTLKHNLFIEGQRHNFTVRYFGLCNQFGVDLDYAYSYILKNGYTSNHTYYKAKDIYYRYAHQFGQKSFGN